MTGCNSTDEELRAFHRGCDISDGYNKGFQEACTMWVDLVKSMQKKYNNPAIQEVLKQLLQEDGE